MSITSAEIYATVHSLGYNWVETPDDFFLLMRSVNRGMGTWEVILTHLQKPSNQELFRYGPDAREAWISEVNALQNKRRKPRDWLNDKRYWTKKLKDSLKEGALISATESLAIYEKCQQRQGAYLYPTNTHPLPNQ